jgi:hypothetical protein
MTRQGRQEKARAEDEGGFQVWRGAFEGDKDEEDDLIDPSQLGKVPSRDSHQFDHSPEASSSPLVQTRSPSLVTSKSINSSPKRKQRKPNKKFRRSNADDEEAEESWSGSDRNMTTERSVAMLPKWRPGKRARARARRGGFVGVYSDIGEEVDEEDDMESHNLEEEETDYDDE